MKRSFLYKIFSGAYFRMFGLAAAAVCCTFTLAADTIAAEAAVSDVVWSDVSLSSDGTADWQVSFPASEAVDAYEIQLARQKDGEWDEDYRTYKTSDEGYDFSFSSKGKYRYKVRIKFIGGEYSDWSHDSNTVNVTSDDIDDGPDSGNAGHGYFVNSYAVYGPGPGTGTYYAYNGPAGPGSGSYTNTTTINTITGQVIYRNGSYNGTSYNTTNPAGASGWRLTNNGYMYVYGNGTYKSNGWDYIDGYWYYFDAYGIMQTGWLYLNNNWYYCLPSGQMAASSWNNINEKWYYFNESGIMQTGYITIDGKTYYTDGSGARVESAYNPDGHLFDLNGVMVS